MLFRTGDLGRVRPEGLLEILGREDSQVKVNGFRIELGEIEKVLTEYEDVSSAALAVHNNVLCAYLVLRSSHTASNSNTDKVISDLKGLCKVKLTEYMIPQYFSVLDELPLSPNGKLQRDKLVPPVSHTESGNQSSTKANYILPSNDKEKAVVTMFSSILNIPSTDICCQQTTFFELGGNSLSSIQLLLSIRNQFKVSITIQDFFVNPTVQGICSFIHNGQQQQQCDNNNEEEAVAVTSNSTNVLTNNARVNVMQELQLPKGSRCTTPGGGVPLILFNPAGASGLW
jgi:acyl carrier protein